MHVFDLYERSLANPGIRLAGICEENVTASLLSNRSPSVEFESFDRMMAESDCEAVAIGDCYGRRGSLVVRALLAGKHVIADKPLCTGRPSGRRSRVLCGIPGMLLRCAKS